MIGQMKHILAAEQKKTDFKPEDENNVLIQYTNVSNQSVTKYKMLLIQLPLYNMCIYLMTSILHQAPPNSVVDCFLKLKRNMSIFLSSVRHKSVGAGGTGTFFLPPKRPKFEIRLLADN